MSDVITTGVFALLGTAIGASLTQVGPMVSGLSQGRQLRASQARERARARVEIQRPLYVELITLVNETARHIDRLRSGYGAGIAESPQLGSLRQAIAANIDSIQALSNKVKIDGGDRAKDVAAKLLRDISDLAEDLDLDLDLDSFTEGSLEKALGGLGEAESGLVEAAREDVGSESEQAGTG